MSGWHKDDLTVRNGLACTTANPRLTAVLISDRLVATVLDHSTQPVDLRFAFGMQRCPQEQLKPTFTTTKPQLYDARVWHRYQVIEGLKNTYWSIYKLNKSADREALQISTDPVQVGQLVSIVGRVRGSNIELVKKVQVSHVAKKTFTIEREVSEGNTIGSAVLDQETKKLIGLVLRQMKSKTRRLLYLNILTLVQPI